MASSSIQNIGVFLTTEKLLVINTDVLPNHKYVVKNSDGYEYSLFVKGRHVYVYNEKGIEILKTQANDVCSGRTHNDINNWLDKKCVDISKIPQMFDMSCQRRQIIVKGYVQSGKTSFMLCSALKFMFGKSHMSSVIILRDSISDLSQIKNRLRDMKENITHFLKCNNFTEEVYFEILDGNVSFEEYHAAFNGVNPKIFVILGNNSQIKKINKMIEKVNESKFALFIDEADSNDTGENQRKEQLEILKDSCSKLFYISATILELGLRDEDVDGDVYMLQDVPHYLGLEKLSHRVLTEKAVSNGQRESDPFENDPNLISFIEKFEQFIPHFIEMYNSKHPQYCLLSCGQVIEPQRKIFEYISGKNITVILYNGDGIDMYDKQLVDKQIIVDQYTSSKCTWKTNAHSFDKKVSISSLIQWLKDNGGVDMFPRIIIISGKLASRGISFTSADYGKYLNSFDKCIPDWVGWRLTSMYYIPSKSTTQPNIMQAIGRVCCISRDNIQTHVYSTEDVFTDLRKAYWLQEEMVVRARQLQSEQENLLINEAMNNIKFQKGKLSKRKLTINATKKIALVNTVGNDEDDNGFDVSKTYFDYVTDDQKINGWTVDITEPENTEEMFLSIEEFNRFTKKMFPIWSKDFSNIACFMQNLDPDKIYSKFDISEFCIHNNIRKGDVMSNETGRSNKYGNIIQKLNNNKFRLYPELVTSYKLFF